MIDRHRFVHLTYSQKNLHSINSPCIFVWLQVPGYNVAYVGNIAFEADVNDMRELMGDCNITKVRMHTDKDTGKFKGYAHVHFADEESLDRCVTLLLM